MPLSIVESVRRIVSDAVLIAQFRGNLIQRILDFAFMRDEDEAGSQVEVEHILNGISVCVMHPKHPLATKETIGPTDLGGVPLILIGNRRPSRTALDAIFARARVTQTVQIETHSNGSACAYAAHGLGIAIVSTSHGVMTDRKALASANPFRTLISTVSSLTPPRLRPPPLRGYC